MTPNSAPVEVAFATPFTLIILACLVLALGVLIAHAKAFATRTFARWRRS